MASFELTAIRDQRVAVRAFSDPVDGTFLVCLPTDHDYALNVSKEGYLFYSDHFSLSGVQDAGKPFLKNIPLQPVKIGETVVLRNIFFDTDKFDLKPESYIELGNLMRLLTQNPSLTIGISGHTDSIGAEEHNLELSRNRAKAVYDYLISQGIPPERMTYAGFGYSLPVESNETEEGRAGNRRTEFKITGR
jgi:outer membrane protein OmpA-like peptidoglycan-associated protein